MGVTALYCKDRRLKAGHATVRSLRFGGDPAAKESHGGG